MGNSESTNYSYNNHNNRNNNYNNSNNNYNNRNTENNNYYDYENNNQNNRVYTTPTVIINPIDEYHHDNNAIIATPIPSNSLPVVDAVPTSNTTLDPSYQNLARMIESSNMEHQRRLGESNANNSQQTYR